ncbi:MAG: hypothetical protein RI566_01550 [Sediminimonas sp.]|uniref:hypothetical protein n=1 Tax=Sediminimonas sp. TaxID=2823379 RepID=UPI00286FF094|nr:hypothetical protein [Sediminimonas sp.]MDR9483833.1 hypothetical protein [Sediminimonas sp.]
MNAFHRDFLVPGDAVVTDPPQEYPVYAPGYYAVFFDDPINGIHWELAHIPRLPGLGALRRFKAALREAERAHPEWDGPPERIAFRKLPRR